MGDPRRQKKKYQTPRFPWRTDVLQEELGLLGQYGLRNKRELWRHRTMLSKFRGISRSLVGRPAEEREKDEKILLTRLKRLGIVHETAVLDDVLDLAIEDILERRLQTIIFRKGLARSIYQARQLITHGHIAIGSQRVTIPGYLVPSDVENLITYTLSSRISNPNHPLRQTIAAVTVDKNKGERGSEMERQ